VTDLNPEQVRHWITLTRRFSDPLTPEDWQFITALADSWLAQGEAITRVLRYASEHHLRGSAAVVSDELLDDLREAMGERRIRPRG